MLIQNPTETLRLDEEGFVLDIENLSYSPDDILYFANEAEDILRQDYIMASMENNKITVYVYTENEKLIDEVLSYFGGSDIRFAVSDSKVLRLLEGRFSLRSIPCNTLDRYGVYGIIDHAVEIPNQR